MSEVTRNKIAEYFDVRARGWDIYCKHDLNVVSAWIAMCGPIRGGNVLDVGCGTGVLEQVLPAFSPGRVLAIDVSQGMIDIAREKHAGFAAAEFRRCDLLELEEKGFDTVILYNVFPHILNRKKAVKHIHDALSPGGRLLVCHGSGREKINGNHGGDASDISIPLPSAADLAGLLSEYFQIDILVDCPHIYGVGGIKRAAV